MIRRSLLAAALAVGLTGAIAAQADGAVKVSAGYGVSCAV
jgi:ABC-type uncharacterized transport system permease subunit